MRVRYQVEFELKMNAATAFNNYEYLDILDRAWAASDMPRPKGGILCDVGCASFWYAATLAAFFSPQELVGVEVEGHRLFQNGHTRIDYASGYVAGLRNARFVVADYRRCELPSDVIVAWFPFVTAPAILAWRLPLSLLAPQQLFERVYHNLHADGIFVMINHGVAEADVAAKFCIAAGLARRFRFEGAGVFSGHRGEGAVVTCWSH